MRDTSFMTIACLAVATTLLFTAGARAEADGPDYFRVTGVPSKDTLNIRSEPSASAPKVGDIPHNADGIRNLGCRAPSFSEWEGMTPSQREAAAHSRWCEVSYNGMKGWVAGRFLAEGSASPQPDAASSNDKAATRPSFDCTKADSSAEKLICGDAVLAALDRETSRLFTLARDGSHMTAARRAELLAFQRGWIKGRDECWKSDDRARCVADEMVQRIAELRQGYADTRKHDAEGISLGPFVAKCPAFGASIGITFVNSNPGFAYAAWSDRSLVLRQAPSGSGARYVLTSPSDSAEIWNKGNHARITLPGRAAMNCSLGTPG